MATQRKLDRHEYESHLANISEAGLRILKHARVSIPANSETTYTVTEKQTRRLALRKKSAAGAGDINIAPLGETADANSFPLLSTEPPIMVDAAEGDVLSMYNESGSERFLHILECA